MNRIKPLTSLDGYVVRMLFRSIFDQSEDRFFSQAWRTRSLALGVTEPVTETLLAAAIVCGNKLEYIFVSEAHQGAGIGSLLLKELLQRKPALYLVPIQNPDVFRWYERHGFHIESRFKQPSLYIMYPYALRSISMNVTAPVQEGTRSRARTIGGRRRR